MSKEEESKSGSTECDESLLEQSKQKLLAQLDSLSAPNDTFESNHSLLDSSIVNNHNLTNGSCLITMHDETLTDPAKTSSSEENAGSASSSDNSGDSAVDLDANIGLNETSISAMHYNFTSPILALDIKEEFNSKEDNYTKGCKWSPDGTCLLVATEDRHIRLFNLPSPVASGNFYNEKWFNEDWKGYCSPAVDVQEGELIYDHCWYPNMRSNDPKTCCFASTCRDLPVHLWDAWTGQLICSYHYYNHLDQLVAAHSVGFSSDGTKMMTGYNKALCVFQTSRPGRQFTAYSTKGHFGVISCFASHPQLSNVFAAGSYSGAIGFYSHNYKRHFLRLEGHSAGVTQISFSKDGTKLFSGARMDNKILCWDIRNPGTLMFSLPRVVETNQRIYFDLDPQQNKYLVSGSTNGKIYVWDFDKDLPISTEGISTPIISPSMSMTPHEDCVNGISLHPYHPILATSSGQRHFPEPVSGSDSEEEKQLTWHNIKSENSVKLWYLG